MHGEINMKIKIKVVTMSINKMEYHECMNNTATDTRSSGRVTSSVRGEWSGGMSG